MDVTEHEIDLIWTLPVQWRMRRFQSRSGGVGNLTHLADGTRGHDAAIIAASIFHFAHDII